MHAHTPPFTKPTGAYDARKLYDETSAIAAAQDAKLDHGNDALSSILADLRAMVKRLEAYAERLRVSRALTELSAESQKLGLYNDLAYTSGERVDETPESVHVTAPQRLAEQGMPAESAYLFKNGSRIATPAEIDGLRDVLTAEELKGFGIGDVDRRHPMHAEVLRDEFERADKETGV